MKNLIQSLFVKSYELKSLYRIELIQLTHIQYMTKYFIKFDHHLNGFLICFRFAIYCYKNYILTTLGKLYSPKPHYPTTKA
jgi:hypothetical protein